MATHGVAGAGDQPVAASGIDIQYIDPAARAQDDFFKYLNGKWLATTPIPADQASWGVFEKLYEDVQPQLRTIIEEAAAKGSNAEEKKLGDFYASFMNEARVEQLGLAPLQAELAQVSGFKDKRALPALIGHFHRFAYSAPFISGVHQDNKDSTKYVIDFMQGGLGLPDRDYYLKKDDAAMADALAKYETHVATMLGLAGNANAAADAKAIVAFETALANIQWSKVALRDPVKLYNPTPIAKLGALMPHFDWKAFLAASGVAGKVSYVNISQPSYMKALDKLLAGTPVPTLQLYFQWIVLHENAPALPKAYVDANFEFYGKVLSGVTEMRPRWKRAVSMTEDGMGEILGKAYVARHFPAANKARMEALVKNLLTAFQQSIDKLDWMTPATRKQAQAKLALFGTKIGYPDKWRDYSALQIDRDDAMGNTLRMRAFQVDRDLNKLGKPIDRSEWGMTPQAINAYYSAEMNEIVFPAAILQPPFFDMAADDAANYGAIGAVIGHEISHGFDDQGAQYDGKGNLRDWWSKADHKQFKAKTDRLVAQYGAFSPLPGYKVNGELTLGENIADNSGLAVAYKAYKLSLHGKEAPVIDGFTGDQRFYMGWAQAWRAKAREPALIRQVTTDPHSPEEFRVNGTLRNQPPFIDAFGVKQGDKMYVAPEQRVIIW